jgi:hypothetical protein
MEMEEFFKSQVTIKINTVCGTMRRMGVKEYFIDYFRFTISGNNVYVSSFAAVDVSLHVPSQQLSIPEQAPDVFLLGLTSKINKTLATDNKFAEAWEAVTSY